MIVLKKNKRKEDIICNKQQNLLPENILQEAFKTEKINTTNGKVKIPKSGTNLTYEQWLELNNIRTL